MEKNIDVLYDDRNLSFGEKKYDLNLIGIPKRVIVGKEHIEYYNENKDPVYVKNIDELLNLLS
jgi:prolyl-tRNA synthetase